jgi:hypothetical protein
MLDESKTYSLTRLMAVQQPPMRQSDLLDFRLVLEDQVYERILRLMFNESTAHTQRIIVGAPHLFSGDVEPQWSNTSTRVLVLIIF